jgi:hypothetical protein
MKYFRFDRKLMEKTEEVLLKQLDLLGQDAVSKDKKTMSCEIINTLSRMLDVNEVSVELPKAHTWKWGDLDIQGLGQILEKLDYEIGKQQRLKDQGENCALEDESAAEVAPNKSALRLSVDSTELDMAIEKANQLLLLVEEVKKSIDSLCKYSATDLAVPTILPEKSRRDQGTLER